MSAKRRPVDMRSVVNLYENERRVVTTRSRILRRYFANARLPSRCVWGRCAQVGVGADATATGSPPQEQSSAANYLTSTQGLCSLAIDSAVTRGGRRRSLRLRRPPARQA